MIKINMSFCPHNTTQLQRFEDFLCCSDPNDMRSMPKCQLVHSKGQRYKKKSSKHNMLQQSQTIMFGI